MKVVLLQDVAKIGKRFDVAEVPDGYAMNMLIPKGLVKPGTPQNVKAVEAAKNSVAKQKEEDAETFASETAKLNEVQLEILVPANEQGHLFEVLKAEKIVDAAKKKSVNLTTTQVHFPTPIKEVGEYEVDLITGEQKILLKIVVKAQ